MLEFEHILLAGSGFLVGVIMGVVISRFLWVEATQDLRDRIRQLEKLVSERNEREKNQVAREETLWQRIAELEFLVDDLRREQQRRMDRERGQE